MPNPRSQDMLVRAATLYYLEGKSQAEVADAIGVSRSNVSRVLADARAQGIVEIRIRDPFTRESALEDSLKERWGLTDVRVAPTGGSGTALARVGKLGAQWLMEHLPQRGRVSVSWGAAVQAVVEAVPDDLAHPNLEVLPLVGGVSIVDSARDGNVLVRLLASRLGARHRRLYAPAVVESKTTRDALLHEPSIASVFDAARSSDIAVVGVGALGTGASAAILDSMHLSADDRRDLIASGAVGDCCTRFFDAQGAATLSTVNDRVLSVTLAELAQIPQVVGVAAGAQKATSMRGALTGGLFDVIVVDQALAAALLEA